LDAIYDKLPRGNYIRLLDVKTAFWSSELICTFKVVSLDDCRDKYKAISYTWGGATPVAQIKFSDGQHALPLSQTLRDLFESLRRKDRKFTVWIDALCINQSDDLEKEAQVLLMGRLYSSASQVLLWLGAGTLESHEAFRFMMSKQTLSWPDDWDRDEEMVGQGFSGLKEVFRLLSRPWFQRVWVIQEATLSDNVLMACGDDCIDFDNFKNCVYAIWKYLGGLAELDYDHPARRGLWGVSRLIDIRKAYHTSGPVRYEMLLEIAFHLQASDIRDKVFAFRDIADKLRSVPKPKYAADMTPKRLFKGTAEALLCHGTSLDLLALCGITRHNEPFDFPSWVPDLRHSQYGEPLVVCNAGGWDAGGPLQVLPKVIPGDRLQVQVQLFDIVDITCPIFDFRTVAGQKEAINAVLALRQRYPADISDKSWIEHLSWSMILGLDIDVQPAGLEYVEYFEEWLQWLRSSTSEDDLTKIRHNKYYNTIGARVDGWQAFMTKKGFFGICAPEVEVKDEVYIVPGCRLPLILRPAPVRPAPEGSGARPPSEKILMSWCFVNCLMHREEINYAESLDEVLLR
jgi:hypothetical protein